MVMQGAMEDGVRYVWSASNVENVATMQTNANQEVVIIARRSTI